MFRKQPLKWVEMSQGVLTTLMSKGVELTLDVAVCSNDVTCCWAW